MKTSSPMLADAIMHTIIDGIVGSRKTSEKGRQNSGKKSIAIAVIPLDAEMMFAKLDFIFLVLLIFSFGTVAVLNGIHNFYFVVV